MYNASCAPGKYDKINKTCFTTDQLVEMAKAYNRFYTKYKLDPNRTHNISSKLIHIKESKPYLLSKFREIFDKVCDGSGSTSEECWTKQGFMNQIAAEIKDDILENTFRTIGPKNSTDWLATADIKGIMEKYNFIYPNFLFLGAVPLDCDSLAFCILYKFDFDYYAKNNITQLAVIFNLDKYGQAGSHWVALFMDLAIGEICYCDSNGNPPIEHINNIINSFKKYYVNKTGHQATYRYNTRPYQKDGSECGVYCCNFIIRKLAGQDFDDIVKNALSFKEINSCRNVYFRNKSSKYEPHPNCDPTNIFNEK